VRAFPLTKSSTTTANQLKRARLLAPRPMSQKEISDLVARARANTTPSAIEGARKQRERNEARRAARGER